MERLFVLSPTGTSLLTNQAIADDRKLVGKYANTKTLEQITEANAQEAQQLQALVERARERLMQADLTLAARMSAELNGIIKLYQGKLQGPQDYHALLCTDTWLGHTTAQLVETWLRAQGLIVEVKRQTNLQTEDIHTFQVALSDLVIWCDEIVVSYRQQGYRAVFNLTGGFKSVQGFLQTLATFYADETIYIFETAKDLLRIPRLPVEMVAEETVRRHLDAFRRLALDLPVADLSDIPETLLMTDGSQTTFSPWGELVWKQSRSKIYRGQVYSPPSERSRLGEEFAKSVQRLAPDLVERVNKKIDDLVKYLELGDEKYNLPSLDFKELRGNPCPPSTHEVDAWADLDAKRLFGHYEGDVFVLDKLDRALH